MVRHLSDALAAQRNIISSHEFLGVLYSIHVHHLRV
jgi:hypothetical protein